MARSPPCPRYQELTTLKEFDDIVAKLDRCAQEEAIQALSNLFMTRRGAVVDLLSRASNGTKETAQKYHDLCVCVCVITHRNVAWHSRK